MIRGMIFVDLLNFDISLHSLYVANDLPTPRLDFVKLFRKVVRCVEGTELLKAYIFAPRPDEFLMQDDHFVRYYRWLQTLKTLPFFDVIEGRYITRATDPNEPKDINKPWTYVKSEKGNDINLAITALSNAFFNSYDAAFFFSADSDYANVYSMLKHMGKLVIQVSVQGQNLNKVLATTTDKQIVLNKWYFENCLLASSPRPAAAPRPATGAGDGEAMSGETPLAPESLANGCDVPPLADDSIPGGNGIL